MEIKVNCPVGSAVISAFLTGLFCFSDINNCSAYTITHFSYENCIGDFTKPLFTEIGVAVIAIEIGYR